MSFVALAWVTIRIVELLELTRGGRPVNTGDRAGVDGILNEGHVALLSCHHGLCVVWEYKNSVGVFNAGATANALPLVDHQDVALGPRTGGFVICATPNGDPVG